MSNNYKGNRLSTSSNTSYNALDFFVKNMINGLVNTALPVRVEAVEEVETSAVSSESNSINNSEESSKERKKPAKAGYVSILPLIQQYDAFGNVLESQIIHNVPYMRLQSGTAAIDILPQVGDIGIAIFAQQDISKVSNIPSKPPSFRAFSMADAVYIGGILGSEPNVFVQLNQEGEVYIFAEQKVIVEAKEVEVETEKATIESKNTIVESDEISISAKDIKLKSTDFTIDADKVQVNGNLMVNTVDFLKHVHGGIQSGSGFTDIPK